MKDNVRVDTWHFARMGFVCVTYLPGERERERSSAVGVGREGAERLFTYIHTLAQQPSQLFRRDRA